ncbi:MAG: T9SS type A sorting domain-containing protein [Gemmatimonadetes bacterium]|nr:T9SS type A sorting domain-containing protein [Gemmatimonadota bacterium]
MRTSRIIRMLASGLLGLALVLTYGCDAAPTTGRAVLETSVTFRGAGTPLSSVRIYNSTGTLIRSASGHGTLSVSLASGKYFVEIVDTDGQAMYDAAGRLFFAPSAEGAILDANPITVSWFRYPLMTVTVGNADGTAGPLFNHTMSDEGSARLRVVWEAARAMVGPAAANSYAWATSDTYGSYNYAGEDAGAWASLKAAYGTNLSCRADNNSTNNYSPCSLTYGPVDPVTYGCQGSCSRATKFHGGQCKAAQNLVLYRSGVYHGANWAFRTLPTDKTISGDPLKYPAAQSGKLQAGDVLRYPNHHSALVVKVTGSSAVVWDSNFIGKDGGEYIASHVLGFSGSGAYNLSNYRVLGCVYKTGTAQC